MAADEEDEAELASLYISSLVAATQDPLLVVDGTRPIKAHWKQAAADFERLPVEQLAAARRGLLRIARAARALVARAAHAAERELLQLAHLLNLEAPTHEPEPRRSAGAHGLARGERWPTWLFEDATAAS